MIIYPGTDPVTPWISYSFAAGYGIWPSPLEAQGADQRSSANLMAAVESLADRSNLLGWRQSLINPIDGSAGSSSFTATITNWNHWVYKNIVDIAPGATENIYGRAIIGNGTGGLATVYVGKTGSGIGHVIIGPDSDITAQGTSGHRGKIIIDSFGNIDVLSGGLLETEIGSGTNLKGTVQQFGKYVQSGADAIQVPRTHTSSAPETIADATIYDVIICKYASINGGISVSNPITLAVPAVGTPLGVRLRITAPKEFIPNTAGGNTLEIDVVSTGGGTGPNGGGIQISAGGVAQSAGFVDLMVMDITPGGGITLAWVVVAQSSSAP